ncbi:MAG TPA: hypothetical protein VGV89_01315 [Thermoplasmata archaeon]|nr:hypothetical protein [Thermoplasmata archaeon]
MKGPRENPGRTRKYFGSRLAGALTGGGIAAVALLLVVAPGGFAAVTVTPPYTGVTSNSLSTSVSGCAHATSAHPFSFNLNTGRAAFTGSTSSSACGGGFGGVGGSAAGSVSSSTSAALHLALPSGRHTLTTNWNATWTAVGSVSGGGSCPTSTYTYSYPPTNYSLTYTDGYCAAESFVQAYVFTYLYDVTNNTYVFPSTSNLSNYDIVIVNAAAQKYTSIYYGCSTSTNGTSCFTYNSSAAGPTTFTSIGTAVDHLVLKGTFASTHTYALLVYVEAYLYSYTSGWAHAKASCSLNLGTLGAGVTLTSFTVH